MKTTRDINQTNFDAEVLKAEEPVVVDFWAQWCGPCKMLAPALEEIASEQAGRVKIAKVNIDENPALAERYGVQAIPTLLYFAKGELQDRSVGAVSKKSILARIEALAAAA